MKINGSATYLLDVLNTKSRFSGQGLFSEIQLFCDFRLEKKYIDRGDNSP